jgi:hypothetical protein
MTLRISLAIVAGLLLTALGGADDKPAESKDDKKPDYAELSKLVQQAIIEKAPKKFEDKSQWGRTIPVHDNVRLPRLKRVVIEKDGKMQYPDGAWKRSFVWLDDPAKDIQIRIKDLKSVAPKTYRVKLDAMVSGHGERERQQWRNGVKLIGITVQADATITAALDIEVKLSFDNSKFPPDVVVTPKVVESKVLLDKFDLNRVGFILVGDDARQLGDELKDFIQALITQHDNDVKDAANEAIAKALKEGKGRISATSLLKITNRAKPKE